jgi:hypothetical protein
MAKRKTNKETENPVYTGKEYIYVKIYLCASSIELNY